MLEKKGIADALAPPRNSLERVAEGAVDRS
jgi:hypothetical protein